MSNMRKATLSILGGLIALCGTASAQIHLVSDEVRRAALREEARIERMVMVPMRDDVRLASRIYIPKDVSGPVPTVFWRTPYNFSELNEGNPNSPSSYLKFALDAVRHGYAFLIQNERGKYFSEGDWEILGFPRTDGYDALTWIAEQPWSDGKVATLGCSSTAEWQPSLVAMNHPAHAAAVPMAYGAGIGRVGEFYEQGNFYRGGAIQRSMITWMFAYQNTQRPLPVDLSREDRIRLARYTDMAVDIPAPDWNVALWHLPLSEMFEAYGGPKGAFDDMASRGPNGSAWYNGALYHDNESYAVPTLWVSSWYDLSSAPNLEIVAHIKEKATDNNIRDSQYIIVAPTPHCAMYRLRNPLIVGERNMGDVDFQLDRILWDFLDAYVKDENNGFRRGEPKVRYFAMGANEWREDNQWPPRGAKAVTYYLSSQDGANTLQGDGLLSTEPPPAGSGSGSGSDLIVYDPTNPVPSLGGNLWGSSAGSFDNRQIEMRSDVLVYSTDAFATSVDVSGKIEIVLYVSSDAKDTDFTVKLLDVYPDGRAMNIDETIQRARYREGYDTQVMMEQDRIYELRVSPMTTSNVFLPGHRLRIEVSSSNFPRFQRNLNTGGDNFTEADPVIARNRVHHSEEYPSRIVLPLIGLHTSTVPRQNRIAVR